METNYANMILNMKIAIAEMYQEHRYLLESDKILSRRKRTNKRNIILQKKMK